MFFTFKNMNYRHLQIFLFLSLLCIKSNAQGLKIDRYHQEDGLPNDLVKSVITDNNGFLWVTTDDGVAKLEGHNFLQVNAQPSKANNFKQILVTKNNKIFVTSDNGVFEITQTFDSIYAENIIDKYNLPKTTSFFYPKTLFNSSDSAIWIADIQNIYRFDKNGIKKYIMPVKNFADHYSRSFSFIETKNNQLFAMSQKGYLYKLNKTDDSFVELTFGQSGIDAFNLHYLNNSSMLLGNNNGLFMLTIDNNDSVISKNLDFYEPVSVVKPDNNGGFVLATWDGDAYFFDLKNTKQTYNLIPNLNAESIIDLTFGKSNELWFATNSGVIMLRTVPFYNPFAKITTKYIQDIDTAQNNNLYFTDGQHVYFHNIDTDTTKSIFKIDKGIILQIEPFKNGVYVATNKGILYYLANNMQTKKHDFSNNGSAIFSITIDTNNNLWFLQSRQQKTAVLCLKPNGIVVDYTPAYNESFYGARIVKCLSNGTLVLAGNNNGANIYEFDYNNQTFNNNSIYIDNYDDHFFKVHDFIVGPNGNTFIATDKGVYEKKTGLYTQINIGKYNNQMVSAISFDSQQRLWCATADGLVVYNGQIEVVYNNNDGMPSKAIIYNSLIIDKNQTLWAGTISGVAKSKIEFEQKITPKPVLSSCLLSGQIIDPYKKNKFYPKNLLSFVFAVPVYPAKYSQIEYSLSQNNNDNYIALPNYLPAVVLNNLKPAKYTLKVRAKYHGNYIWSQPYIYKFNIVKVWYARVWVLVLFYVLVIAILFAYIYYIRWKNNREKTRLETIINERTRKLQDRNNELTNLNNELITAKHNAELAIKSKDRFFSILAHDLKSAFNTLIGFSQLLVTNRNEFSPDEMKILLNEMLNTSENTYKLLQNLLDWARTQTGAMTIKPEKILLTELVSETFTLIEPAANQKNIELISKVENNITWFADIAIVSTVLRNIITNAIKFSFPNSKIIIESYFDSYYATIVVIDQGIGMDKVKIDQLFSIEASHATKGTANEKGTGLGLVLCKELIDKSNGFINVDSNPGVGSKFYIKLPLSKQKVKQTSPPQKVI